MKTEIVRLEHLGGEELAPQEDDGAAAQAGEDCADDVEDAGRGAEQAEHGPAQHRGPHAGESRRRPGERVDLGEGLVPVQQGDQERHADDVAQKGDDPQRLDLGKTGRAGIA